MRRERDIGPFLIMGELGRGAMAIVWQAFDRRTKRVVALKEPYFHPNMPERVIFEMRRRFVSEGKAAARLRHRNIVQIIDAGEWDGHPVIAMELIEGLTLSNLLATRGALPPREVASILDQLLDAVGYAHENGVIHRDIKPENVFITNDGTVKLADFGDRKSVV